MPQTWLNILHSYNYPVDLRRFGRANLFAGFFEKNIVGDRNSTIAFEAHFQQNAPYHIEAFFEVVFWKLYSQPQWREKSTNRIVDFIQKNKISSQQLWNAINLFLDDSSTFHLQQIRTLLGLKTKVLAIPLTLCALTQPKNFPVIDNNVARWVNFNANLHNQNRENELSLFNMRSTVLLDDDFNNYLNWIAWCREVSQVLTNRTSLTWRARDVEMVVFTAQRNNLELSVLP